MGWLNKKKNQAKRRVTKKVKKKLHLAHDWSGWTTDSSWDGGDGKTVRSQHRECRTWQCKAREQRTRKS